MEPESFFNDEITSDSSIRVSKRIILPLIASADPKKVIIQQDYDRAQI